MDYTTQRPLGVGMEIRVTNGAGSVMSIDVLAVIKTLPFRVLVEFDEDYSEWIARCIDTDAVATGINQEAAEEGIKMVLGNDISVAVREGSIKNLVQTRSSWDIVERWYQAVQSDPNNVRTDVINIPNTPSEIPATPKPPQFEL